MTHNELSPFNISYLNAGLSFDISKSVDFLKPDFLIYIFY